MLTITEQLKNLMPYLNNELPALKQRPSFYKDIDKAIDIEDKKLRNSIELFKYIISIVGE